MGQIQQAINQMTSSALGAAVAGKHISQQAKQLEVAEKEQLINSYTQEAGLKKEIADQEAAEATQAVKEQQHNVNVQQGRVGYQAKLLNETKKELAEDPNVLNQLAHKQQLHRVEVEKSIQSDKLNKQKELLSQALRKQTEATEAQANIQKVTLEANKKKLEATQARRKELEKKYGSMLPEGGAK